MDSEHGFSQANQSWFRVLHNRWHRQQCQTQILRSQVGFVKRQSSRPTACEGCSNYHGKAYGSENRQMLICAIHPHGWPFATCPDWQAEA